MPHPQPPPLHPPIQPLLIQHLTATSTNARPPPPGPPSTTPPPPPPPHHRIGRRHQAPPQRRFSPRVGAATPDLVQVMTGNDITTHHNYSGQRRHPRLLDFTNHPHVLATITPACRPVRVIDLVCCSDKITVHSTSEKSGHCTVPPRPRRRHHRPSSQDGVRRACVVASPAGAHGASTAALQPVAAGRPRARRARRARRAPSSACRCCRPQPPAHAAAAAHAAPPRHSWLTTSGLKWLHRHFHTPLHFCTHISHTTCPRLCIHPHPRRPRRPGGRASSCAHAHTHTHTHTQRERESD